VMFVEVGDQGQAESLGSSRARIAGLVAITTPPALSIPKGAMIIGSRRACCAYWGATGPERTRLRRQPGAFGVHGVGGVTGGDPDRRLAVVGDRRRGTYGPCRRRHAHQVSQQLYGVA